MTQELRCNAASRSCETGTRDDRHRGSGHHERWLARRRRAGRDRSATTPRLGPERLSPIAVGGPLVVRGGPREAGLALVMQAYRCYCSSRR